MAIFHRGRRWWQGLSGLKRGLIIGAIVGVLAIVAITLIIATGGAGIPGAAAIIGAQVASDAILGFASSILASVATGAAALGGGLAILGAGIMTGAIAIVGLFGWVAEKIFGAPNPPETPQTIVVPAAGTAPDVADNDLDIPEVPEVTTIGNAINQLQANIGNIVASDSDLVVLNIFVNAWDTELEKVSNKAEAIVLKSKIAAQLYRYLQNNEIYNVVAGPLASLIGLNAMQADNKEEFLTAARAKLLKEGIIKDPYVYNSEDENDSLQSWIGQKNENTSVTQPGKHYVHNEEFTNSNYEEFTNSNELKN